MKPSIVVRPSTAIPAKKRIAIYELSNHKDFIQPDFVWKILIKRTPRSHVPSGKKGRSIAKAKEKRLVLNSKRGQVDLGKIAAHLGISRSVVHKYLNHKHDKGREKYAAERINIPGRTRLSVNERERLKTKLWYGNNNEYKLKSSESLAIDLLHNKSWKGKRIEIGRCEKCNIIKGGNTKTNHKKHCSSCSMKENSHMKRSSQTTSLPNKEVKE